MFPEDSPTQPNYPVDRDPQREDGAMTISPRGSQLPLSVQEKEIANLHDALGELSHKLKLVLSPSVPSEGTMKGEGDMPPSSPLVAQLTANNNGINLATRKVRGLIERLEC